ncbi:hypothetical protein ACFL27_19220 [candidate division CSSED10-310 bacterium]|uniref:Calcineurin-like phosphoesterase domain-containing protein n=1 Tax=candidate division CSSED10-310 bacterium TaxID=2855610 RepID=A0ABV6Z1K6_UNCC1
MVRYDLPEKFDRLLVVFSDIEMGEGGDEDDFPHSEFLGKLLLSYLEGELGDVPIDFIFNGDTFDLLKISYQGKYPYHITEDIGLAKMSSVAAAHNKFFESVRQILKHSTSNKNVYFIVGNHDTELLFPLVQDFIRTLCGNSTAAHFPGFYVTIGPVYCEHGQQADPLFRLDPEKPFVEDKGKQYLNLSWATIALLDIMIPLKPILYFHDRLRPKARVLKFIPEISELLIGLAWKYWTKDFWRQYLTNKDPMLHLNWTMIKEIVRRFSTRSPEVSFDKSLLKKVINTRPEQLFISGHLHRIGTFYNGNQRIINAGCFRDEYLLLEDGAKYIPALKSYYEVYLLADQIVRIVTREIIGPERAPSSFPDTIYDVVPKVEELLDQLGDHRKAKEGQREQEKEDAQN